MPTHYECAVMSREVYNKDGGTPPAGWSVCHHYYPSNRWGVGAAVYKNGNERVIAFRGTRAFVDVLVDFGLVLGQIPPGAFDSRIMAGYRKKNGTFQKIISGVLNFIRTLGAGDTIYYTGHSLGGCIAAIRACSEQRPAIIFDSPGCLPFLEPNEITWGNGPHRVSMLGQAKEPNITSYVSAPNPINTLNRHIGQVRRLQVNSDRDRSVPSKIYKLFHAISHVMYDVLRIIFSLHALSYFMPLPKKLYEVDSNTLMTVFLLVFTVKLIRDVAWLQTQHSIANLVDCFDPETGKVKQSNHDTPENGKKMSSWPTSWDCHLSRIQRFCFFLVPAVPAHFSFGSPLLTFASGNRGLLGLFSRGYVDDYRATTMPGYK